jgi:energy-coupling factor transporter ATP-binding protein EcfA2
MAYLARHTHDCPKCGKQILGGVHFITHDRNTKGRYYHADCSNPERNPASSNGASSGAQEAQEAQEQDQASAQEQEAPKAIELTEAQEAPASAPSDPWGAMATALIPHLQGKIGFDPNAIQRVIETKAETVKQEFSSLFVDRIETVKAELTKALDNYATKLDISIAPAGKTIRVDNAHPMLKRLVYLVSKRRHVYLYGPAGSGKSFGARQCAEALGLNYGEIALNEMSMPSLLFGFVDANGRYVRTVFRDVYENGGVMAIDEMDNANGNFMTKLNGALANGHCDFPDGMVKRHPDFVCVGTGNTIGHGGDTNYADRRPFDGATRDRFAFLAWGYDRKLERSIALSINEDATPWINWVHSVRQFCESRYPNMIVSPRATFGGAELLKDSGWSIEDVAECVLFKGLDKDSKDAILSAHPYPDYKPSEVSTEAN